MCQKYFQFSKSFCRILWLSVLVLFSVYSLWSLPTPVPSLTSEQKLQRLSQIITQLSLNLAQRQTELQLSTTTSQTAKQQVTALETNLATLQSQLDEAKSLQKTLTDQLVKSKTDSDDLVSKLVAINSSLAKLQSSFDDYKKSAESTIAKLTSEKTLAWIIVGVAAGGSFFIGYEIGKNAK